jgi:hypothetical protein
MPVNHVSLPTTPASFTAMRTFYTTTLTPLGYSIYLDLPDRFLGLGPKGGAPDFWLHCSSDAKDADIKGAAHVAFDGGSRKAVDEWHAAAM